MTGTSVQPDTGMRVYDRDGHRLYLNAEERTRFIRAANRTEQRKRLFALTLLYSGCRISEARALRLCDVQLSSQVITVRTLKRRNPSAVREIPIPYNLAKELTQLSKFPRNYLWSRHGEMVPRVTSYRWIKEMMDEASIEGRQATPKGLRHGFGVQATISGVQLHMLSRWMGHASIETTAIYATVVGREEVELAERMWG